MLFSLPIRNAYECTVEVTLWNFFRFSSRLPKNSFLVTNFIDYSSAFEGDPFPLYEMPRSYLFTECPRQVDMVQ